MSDGPRSVPGVDIGDILVERTVPVTRERLVRYAGASGDFNPIHYSDRVASAVGLPGVIAHGMLTMALVGDALLSWVDSADDVLELGARFSRPVVVPDDDVGVELTVTARVRELGDDGTVGVDLTASSAGQRVLTGARARLRVPQGDGVRDDVVQ